MRPRTRRRMIAKMMLGAGLVVVLHAGPAAAAQPRVTGCMGTDTSYGAIVGGTGQHRSWLAVDGNEIFGYGFSFGDIVQAHQTGYLGGSCAS